MLSELRNIFLKAYRMIDDKNLSFSKQLEKQRLIKEWNDEIYRLNRLLSGNCEEKRK